MMMALWGLICYVIGLYVGWIEHKITQARQDALKEGRENERQFILNILDGIDAADEQMGNKGGGTKAIRLALQSRIID